MEVKMNRRETQRIISPPGRTRSKIIAFVLAIASFSLVVALPSHAEEKINIKVDYVAKLNELAKAGRPEELNAATYYNKSFELCVEQYEQQKKIYRKIWPTDLPPKQLAILEAWVRQNVKALAELRKGTQKPHYWPEYRGTSMVGIVLPELGKAKALAIALCSRAKLNAAKGNCKEAFSDLLACYRFGTHFTGPKTLIEQLVGLAIRSIATNAAFQILDKENPTPDLLKDFQLQLQKFSSQEKFTFDFTAEKFSAYDIIQRMFTDDGKGGGHIPELSTDQKENWPDSVKVLLSVLTEVQIRALAKVDRRETTDLTNKVYEYFDKASHKTPWQLNTEGKDVQKVIAEMIKGNPFLRLFMPVIGRVVEISFRCEVETDALVTTIAILRYKADKGQYPENLEELASAGYLDKLPMDPYSDNPLIYKRAKDNFTLYSFGADFDDDGGAPSKWGEGEKGGDQVFWPVQPTQKPKAKR
jgi:hypothetical protein